MASPPCGNITRRCRAFARQQNGRDVEDSTPRPDDDCVAYFFPFGFLAAFFAAFFAAGFAAFLDGFFAILAAFLSAFFGAGFALLTVFFGAAFALAAGFTAGLGTGFAAGAAFALEA